MVENVAPKEYRWKNVCSFVSRAAPNKWEDGARAQAIFEEEGEEEAKNRYV